MSLRDVRWGTKVDQIGPKWDKSEIFLDIMISVHFGSYRRILSICNILITTDYYCKKHIKLRQFRSIINYWCTVE